MQLVNFPSKNFSSFFVTVTPWLPGEFKVCSNCPCAQREVLWRGEGEGTSPCVQNLDTRMASALRSGHFTPGRRPPTVHWIRGWVNPRADLDASEKRKPLVTAVNLTTIALSPTGNLITVCLRLRSCRSVDCGLRTRLFIVPCYVQSFYLSAITESPLFITKCVALCQGIYKA